MSTNNLNTLTQNLNKIPIYIYRDNMYLIDIDTQAYVFKQIYISINKCVSIQKIYMYIYSINVYYMVVV